MINVDFISISNAFWSCIANHLWQSTLFAVGAWLITLFFKKNRARIRYWIWFSVSIKFLIPFSLIVTLGGLIAPEWMKAPVEIPPQWNVIQTIHQPFNVPELKHEFAAENILDSSSPSNNIPFIIAVIWLCGSSALLLNWHKRGIRVSRIVGKADLLGDDNTVKGFYRIKQKNRISNAVKLASTKDMMEPGVYGIFRPVLLLPTGILEHINDSELEAILIHEFHHIRYKDNLVAFIHMIVQAVFWFHPVVWWTGSRLLFERELACDESVLQYGKNPQAYAEGIIKVCEYYFKSPSLCVSGVIGADLKKRMEVIMKNQIGHELSMIKRFFLLLAGLSVLGIPLLLGIINAPPALALSSGSDLNNYHVDENKTDTFKLLSKPESNRGSSEMISNEQNNFSMTSNRTTTLPKMKSDEPVLENESSAVVTENVNIQIADKSEKKIESSKAVRKGVSSTGTKDIIEVAQINTPVKVVSDEVNKDNEIKKENADIYLSSGISFMKKGRLEEAVSNFDRAIDLDQGKALAYVARGSAYQWLDQPDNAISDYNRAIEINPDIAIVYQNRGTIYLNQGKFDNAISDYNKVLELNPVNAAAYSSRGTAHFSQRQYQEALNDFNRAIKLNPEYSSAYINRGRCYHIQKKYDKAISDYNKALELNPNSVFRKKIDDYCKWAQAGRGWSAGQQGTSYRPAPTMNGMDYYAGQMAQQKLANGK